MSNTGKPLAEYPLLERINTELYERAGQLSGREGGYYVDLPTTYVDIAHTFHSVVEGTNTGEPIVTYGTSYCAADIKEVLQLAMLQQTMLDAGIPTSQIFMEYFIDPNAHTSGELLRGMERDLGLSSDTFMSMPFTICDGTNTLCTNFEHVSPQFVSKPSAADICQIQGLDSRIQDLMLQVCELEEIKTLGDWRVEIDRRCISDLYQRLGISPEVISVVPFHSRLTNPEITISDICRYINSVDQDLVPEVQRIFAGSHDSALNAETQSPLVMRIVLPDGRRVGIDTKLNCIGWDEFGGRVVLTNPTIYQFISNIVEQPIIDVYSETSLQPSGLGYYALLELNQAGKGPIVMPIDDYETARGPLSMALAAEHLKPIVMPKGLVGLSLPSGGTDFDSTPDVLITLLMQESDITQLKNHVDTMTSILKSSNITAVSGVTVSLQGEVSEPLMYKSKRTVLQLAEMLPEFVTRWNVPGLSPVSLHCDFTSEMLPTTLLALDPDRFATLMFPTFSNVGSLESYNARLSWLGMLQSLGYEIIDHDTGEDLLYAVTQGLQTIAHCLELGHELASKVDASLSADQWKLYWYNSSQATLAAIDTHFPDLSVNYNIHEAFLNVETPDDAKKASNMLDAALDEAIIYYTRLWFTQNRPDDVKDIDKQFHACNMCRREASSIYKLRGVLSRGDLGISTEALSALSPNTLTVIKASLNAFTGDIPDTYLDNNKGVNLCNIMNSLKCYEHGLVGSFSAEDAQTAYTELTAMYDALGIDVEHAQTEERQTVRGMSKPTKIIAAMFDLNIDSLHFAQQFEGDVSALTLHLEHLNTVFWEEVNTLCSLLGMEPIPVNLTPYKRGAPTTAFNYLYEQLQERCVVIARLADLSNNDSNIFPMLHGLLNGATLSELQIDANTVATLHDQLLRAQSNTLLTPIREDARMLWRNFNASDGSLTTALQDKLNLEALVYNEVNLPINAATEDLQALAEDVSVRYAQWWCAVAKKVLQGTSLES